MGATLHMRMLGGFAIEQQGAPIATIASPRLQALLAYLALHRDQPQPRQRLAAALWPDSSESQAHTNLRTLLHRLHAALPDADRVLCIDAQSIAWHPAAALTLDVAEFEAALIRAGQAAQAGDDDAAGAALEQAALCYAGDLLPDCYDEWVLPERERLQQRLLEALERLAALLERRRDYATALVYARRLLQLDPLNEAAYLSLMRLHAVGGDRAGALRAYHTCATVLASEVGSAPGGAIRAAYERLLAAEASPLVDMSPVTPLVGRAREWVEMQAAWQSAIAGSPRLLVLSGEAGIGKTRLADELLRWAGRQGVAVAVAHCYAAEGDLAYAPAIAWLRCDALRPALARLDAAWLSEVARLAPELLPARPDVPRSRPLTQSWQRQRLFEALARAFHAVGHPLLLLIDDLQWCDQDTLEWLHFLLRSGPPERLLIVGTVRVEEPAAAQSLAELLDALRHESRASEIGLGPLSPAQTAELAGLIAGRALSQEQAADMFAETEGNPLFVVETVRAGFGAALTAERGAAAQPASAQPQLPPGVQAVIARRLKQVTPAARELLRVAAVIGRSFVFGVLARAADASEDDLVRGLDELWQRRIVREHGLDAYDFTHDKLRAVAYESLSTARRRVLHRRVADAIVAEHGANLDAVSAQIASHYERAGMPGPAASYYRRAAESAARLYANAESIGYYRRALAEEDVARASAHARALLDNRQQRPPASLEPAVCAAEAEMIAEAGARLADARALARELGFL